MRKVAIFLSASEDTLNKERVEITNLIRHVNTLYSSKQIHLKLYKTGGDTECTEQDLLGSEIVILVCAKDILPEDLQYFDLAVGGVEGHAIKIVTYFRSGDSYTDNLNGFLQRLDQELGHYYTQYDSLDSLRFRILLNLLSLEQDIKAEYKDGQILLEGKALGSMDNMPCLLGNSHLRDMKAKLDKLTEQYYIAQECYYDNETDDNYLHFSNLATEKERLQEQISQLEQDVFSAMTKLASDTAKSGLSAMQRQAYRYLEQGQYDKADDVLDFGVISADIQNNQQLLQMSQQFLIQKQNEQRQNIDKILQKIDAKLLRRELADRYSQVKQLYQYAVDAEQQAMLEPIVAIKYADYLYDQRDYNGAIEVVNHYAHSYYVNSQHNHDQKQEMYNLLALCYSANGNIDKASEAYEWLLTINKQLVAEDNDKYQLDMAVVYNNVAMYYSDIGMLDKAEELYGESLGILSQLPIDNISQSSIALRYINLSCLYSDTDRHDQAEELAREALEIYQQLAQQDSDSYLGDLAYAYCNLASIRGDIGMMEGVEQLFLDAISIYIPLVASNSDKYQPELALAYNNLAKHYLDIDNYSDALQYYAKCIEIYNQLLTANPNVYLGKLALVYNALADTYGYMEQWDMVIHTYTKLIELLERLCKIFQNDYSKQLADTYYNLSDVYYRQDDITNALSMSHSELQWRKNLAKDNDQQSLNDLAVCYRELALMYTLLDSTDSAVECYVLAIDTINRSLQVDSTCESQQFFADCNNMLGTIYMENAQFDNAESHFVSAFRMYGTLADIDEQYLPELGECYYNMCKVSYCIEDMSQAMQFGAVGVQIFEHCHMQFDEDYSDNIDYGNELLGMIQEG